MKRETSLRMERVSAQAVGNPKEEQGKFLLVSQKNMNVTACVISLEIILLLECKQQETKL